MKNFTKEHFVRKARSVHGDTYDYTYSVYVNNSTELRIDCKKPSHGPFWQAPGNHCRGNGCPVCATERRVAMVIEDAAEKFFVQAKERHLNAYTYDQAVYTGRHSELKIHCPDHGDFMQKASLHLAGAGCPECDVEAGGGKRRQANMRFLRKAATVHGADYDYTRVRYLDFMTKVEVICQRHGSFFIVPTHHLGGAGCPACGMERSCANRTDRLDTFIEKAIARHGERLDYSQVVYVNSRTKVIIKCPIHGPFSKTPAEHIAGAGCPVCGRARRGRPVRNREYGRT